MLTQTGEYALRAVTFIGKHQSEGPVSAKDIATATKVSLKYLQKVLRDLVRSGVLSSVRGIGGGFRLGRPSDQLVLLEIVQQFDSSLRRPTCPFGNPKCGDGHACPVHDRWSLVVEAYKNFLEETTLADVIAAE